MTDVAVASDKKDLASNPLRARQISRLIPALREHLGKRLPQYMVPSFFVFVDSWPLTSNGKLDRKALPDPESFKVRTEKYVAPRTDVERTLIEIWSEVLGLEKH